jgi:hypothetical protein
MGVSQGHARAGSGQRSCVDDSRAGGGLSTVGSVWRGVAGMGGGWRGCGRRGNFADSSGTLPLNVKVASVGQDWTIDRFGGLFLRFSLKEGNYPIRGRSRRHGHALASPPGCAPPLHVRPPSQGQNCQVLNIVELSGEKWVPRVGRERQSVIGRSNRPIGCTNPLPFAVPLGRMGATAV